MAAEADHRGRHLHGVATNPSSGHPRMDGEGQGPEHDAEGRSCGRGRERDRRGREAQGEDEPGENPMREMETQAGGHKVPGRPPKEAGRPGFILSPVKNYPAAPPPPAWNPEG